MTIPQDLELWFKRYRDPDKPIPEIESKLEEWFKKQGTKLADTFKEIRRKDPRISIEEIFEILVNLKLVEFYCEEVRDVSLKKFDLTLNRAWKGLVILWLLEFVDSEGVVLNNRRLSWPELAALSLVLFGLAALLAFALEFLRRARHRRKHPEQRPGDPL